MGSRDVYALLYAHYGCTNGDCPCGALASAFPRIQAKAAKARQKLYRDFEKQRERSGRG